MVSHHPKRAHRGRLVSDRIPRPKGTQGKYQKLVTRLMLFVESDARSARGSEALHKKTRKVDQSQPRAGDIAVGAYDQYSDTVSDMYDQEMGDEASESDSTRSRREVGARRHPQDGQEESMDSERARAHLAAAVGVQTILEDKLYMALLSAGEAIKEMHGRGISVHERNTTRGNKKMAERIAEAFGVIRTDNTGSKNQAGPTASKKKVDTRLAKLEDIMEKIAKKVLAEPTPLDAVEKRVQLPPLKTSATIVPKQPGVQEEARTNHATGPTFKPVKKIGPFQRNNDTRLIIKLSTPVPVEQLRKKAAAIRDRINEILKPLLKPSSHAVSGVDFSSQANIVVFAGPGLKAVDIEPHAGAFIHLFAGDAATPESWQATADAKWWKVQVSHVPVHKMEYSMEDNAMRSVNTPDDIVWELREFNPHLAHIEMAVAPRWMSGADMLSYKTTTSIVLAMRTEEGAREFLMTDIFLFGAVCWTGVYIDIPPIKPCLNCWKLEHATRYCKVQVVCRRCSGPHQEEDHYCATCKTGDACEHEACVNCQGEHAADDRGCPYRLRYKGLTIKGAPQVLGGVAKYQSNTAKPAAKSKKGKGKKAKTLPVPESAGLTPAAERLDHGSIESLGEERVHLARLRNLSKTGAQIAPPMHLINEYGVPTPVNRFDMLVDVEPETPPMQLMSSSLMGWNDTTNIERPVC